MSLQKIFLRQGLRGATANRSRSVRNRKWSAQAASIALELLATSHSTTDYFSPLAIFSLGVTENGEEKEEKR